MKKAKEYFYGIAVGFLNGLFGSGGGTVAVPCLEKSGLEAKKAHATSVALIFILSLVTAIVYLLNGKLNLNEAMNYIPYGIIGAITGAMLLKKISNTFLKKLFAVIILISAIRILIQ